MQIKCLAIKVPLNSKVPKPNFYRNITHLNSNTKVEIYAKECFYWLDNFAYSDKQLIWLGDIKTKIQKLIPDTTFIEYNTDSRYVELHDNYFTLKSLQKVWSRKITDNKKKIITKISSGNNEERVTLPSLMPMIGGKTEASIYRVLTQYATRLHYEKMFQFEYLYSASKLYNKNLDDKILPKKLLTITRKAFNFISDEIENNPENFKQRLDPKELRHIRIKHGATVLQSANIKRRVHNTKLIKEAIATDRCYKADGESLNVSAIVTLTKLNRKTVTAIAKELVL